MLRGFVLGAVVGPVLIVLFAYLFANPNVILIGLGMAVAVPVLILVFAATGAAADRRRRARARDALECDREASDAFDVPDAPVEPRR